MPEPTDGEYPVPAPDRPRQRRAVAHADADGQVGRPPQALPARPLRRDQPRRRRGPRPAPGPVGRRRIAARVGRVPGRSSPRPSRRDSVFLPMHDGATNRLTLAVFDPESRQPAYKACAVAGPPARHGEVPSDHDVLDGLIDRQHEDPTMIATGIAAEDRRGDRQRHGRPPVLRTAGGLRPRPPLPDRDVLRGAAAGLRSRQPVEILRAARAPST